MTAWREPTVAPAALISPATGPCAGWFEALSFGSWLEENDVHALQEVLLCVES